MEDKHDQVKVEQLAKISTDDDCCRVQSGSEAAQLKYSDKEEFPVLISIQQVEILPDLC
jgi:hypothetical protein